MKVLFIEAKQKDLDLEFKIPKKELKKLQNGDIYSWVKETREITIQIYKSAEIGEELSYGYSYEFWPVVEQQLLVGGIRLAGILNKIYG